MDIKKSENIELLLHHVNENRGMLWEKIEEFRQQIMGIEGSIDHHTQEMEEVFPTTHHIANGLYTREVFMPKGACVISYVHKQDHPSFLLKGELSILNDAGEIQRLKAPMTVHTSVGTQRIAVIHEDTTWVCVYKTDKKTVEEAEKDVYTTDFRELPEHVISNKKLLCQD